jgi:prolyl-tRNA editing enzyme YbaK/EbsC (Cys-tRNA(Pro) deacylase)
MAAGISRFEQWLDEQGHGIDVRRFAQGTRTAEDAAGAIGCKVGQIVKSLVFTAGGRPVVALVSGANRLDPARLSRLAGGAVEKADAEIARRATGYAIGGVPPFGHAEPLPVFMDRDLEAYDVVWAAAGRPDAVFPITPEQLRKLSQALVAELSA